MTSQFFTRDASEHLFWSRFRRRTLGFTVCFFTAYTLGSASFLQRRFDLEYVTDAYRTRVMRAAPPPASQRAPDPAAVPSMRGKTFSSAMRPRGDKAYLPELSELDPLDTISKPAVTTTSALFLDALQTAPRSYDDLARTTRVGDVLLLKGTGSMSWKITNLTYAWRRWEPWALRYSHTSVVVDVDRSVDPPRVWILEGVDNRDASVKSRDGVVRHRQVQVVDARERIFSVRPLEEYEAQQRTVRGRAAALWRLLRGVPPDTEEQIWHKRRCYSRAAFRRLERQVPPAAAAAGEEALLNGTSVLTKDELKIVDAFVQRNVGRPIDASPRVALTQIDPALYLRAENDPEKVTCTELIVDLYKELGLVFSKERIEAERRRQAAQGRDAAIDNAANGGYKHLIKESVAFIPYHFTPKGERDGLSAAATATGSTVLPWTERNVRLGAELRVLMGE